MFEKLKDYLKWKIAEIFFKEELEDLKLDMEIQKLRDEGHT